MPWQPRCRRCHRVLKDAEAVKHGYGRVCFFKVFGKKPGKAKLRIQKFKSYFRYEDIPPLFKYLYPEEVNPLGTIHIRNLSSITDKAAVTLVSDYWNDRDNEELIETMKDLNVKIIKRGHTFRVLDIEQGVK